MKKVNEIDILKKDVADLKEQVSELQQPNIDKIIEQINRKTNKNISLQI